ncbi:unnamed protein product [Paramecium octaurelia]|uniref:Transmembrane protein n=1 Tax=Paramecium octaurelia TaxID=43137 RepID=A0A8S1WVC3_PAROT|nr:unnamed protein product [Paramecium octaurelia]
MNTMGAFPQFSFTKEQAISLYPTEGEFFEYYIDTTVLDQQLICKIDPYVPNVQIMNLCEEIYQIQGNQFISMSSNNTHFGTLSFQNEVYIYQWKDQLFEQVGESVKIDASFSCFNINLSYDFKILIDCYQNNQLLFIQIMEAQSIIAYSIQSSSPSSTKIQSIINGTNAFIVYAQYFENYSILSLFSSQFVNESSLTNQFVDFDIPLTISPNIYIITNQVLFQLTISSDSQLCLKNQFSYNDMNNFTCINVYYDLQIFSQCDQILLMQTLPYQEICIISLLGCENQVLMIDKDCQFVFEPISKILQNNQFIIYKLNDTISIQEKQSNGVVSYELNHQINSLIYLNSANELFVFNSQITVYKIQFPSLQVNLTNLENVGNNYTFLLKCQNKGQFTFSKVYLQELSQNDTNVYVMFNQYLPQNQTSLNLKVTSFFVSFSGQLLQYQQNPIGIPLNFTLIAQQQAGQINQSYSLVQSLSMSLYYSQQILIGYNNYSIDILLNQVTSPESGYQFTIISSINTSANASSLQVGYSIFPLVILIGLRANNTIYLYQYQHDTNRLISYSNNTFQQQFSDFLVTYNNIIILFPNEEIQIMTLQFTNIITLNQQSISKFFRNIQFNPIQIVMNTQLQSSLLYINNRQEVIRISINQNNLPIPISLIQVNFTIKQINLINHQLILSYLCNNGQNLCFSVWNVQYLQKSYHVKNLYSLNIENVIKISSDSIFLYVTFSNYTVYAYNPSLPYHQSLYYMLNFSSPILCSQAITSYYIYQPQYQYLFSMVLLSNNSIYELYEFQKYETSVESQDQVFNYSISYPQYIYNYTVTSALNDKALQQTPNQSIIIYSNFTVFLNQSNLSINLSFDNIIPGSKNFSYPMNLILDRQVGYCGSTNLTSAYDFNKYCSITQQFFHQSSSIPNLSNFSLVTSIKNQCFALQNNSHLQIVNSGLNYISNFNYSNLKQKECLKSASDDYTLYSICENSTSQYLLNFTLNCEGDIVLVDTIQLSVRFQNIQKMSTLLNQIFILGTLENSLQQLYWFYQSYNIILEIDNTNEFAEDLFVCNDFSIVQIQQQIQNHIPQKIIFFYAQAYQIFGRIMLIDDSEIKIREPISVIIYYCDQQQVCYEPLISYSLVQIIQKYTQSLTMLVGNIYFSSIVEIRLKQFQKSGYQPYSGIAIRTIPNYGNSSNNGNSFYQNGVLMQQFQYNKTNIIGVYYLNHLLDGNLLEPILMQGSFNTPITDYAMIVNQQYQYGTSLYFYNKSIYNYSIGTWILNCLANTRQNYIDISIFCLNEFQNGTYNIKFYLPPQFHFNFGPSVYVLFSLIFLLLLYFYLKIIRKTKNSGYIFSEIEL